MISYPKDIWVVVLVVMIINVKIVDTSMMDPLIDCPVWVQFSLSVLTYLKDIWVIILIVIIVVMKIIDMMEIINCSVWIQFICPDFCPHRSCSVIS